MKTSNEGIELIKSFEGVRLRAYPDPGTGGAPWTIGVGHTGPDVVSGRVITMAQSDAYLAADLAKFEASVNSLVKTTLLQNQFDALVSFTYNVGAGNLKSSTLLKKVNARDFVGAAVEFSKWNKAAGKVLPGLTRRRAAEADLFSRESASVAAPTTPAATPSSTAEAPTASTATPAGPGFWAAVIAAIAAMFRKA